MSTQEFNAQLTKEFSLSTQQIEALNRLGVNDLTDFGVNRKNALVFQLKYIE
jgi:uncharacterized protein YjiS (DUF1127 family)